MIAVKENKQYTITEVDIKSFKAEGYDIYADDGKLIAYGAGKTVPYERYAKLSERVETLNDENVALRDEIEKLTAEVEKLKAKATKKKGKE